MTLDVSGGSTFSEGFGEPHHLSIPNMMIHHYCSWIYSSQCSYIRVLCSIQPSLPSWIRATGWRDLGDSLGEFNRISSIARSIGVRPSREVYDIICGFKLKKLIGMCESCVFLTSTASHWLSTSVVSMLATNSRELKGRLGCKDRPILDWKIHWIRWRWMHGRRQQSILQWQERGEHLRIFEVKMKKVFQCFYIEHCMKISSRADSAQIRLELASKQNNSSMEVALGWLSSAINLENEPVRCFFSAHRLHVTVFWFDRDKLRFRSKEIHRMLPCMIVQP